MIEKTKVQRKTSDFGLRPPLAMPTWQFRMARRESCVPTSYAGCKAFSSSAIAFTETFASPNSMDVFGLKNSGFWIPA